MSGEPLLDIERARAISVFTTCILNVIYVYLLLIYVIVVYVFLDEATLTEVFPCFFLSCKTNARV